MIDPVASVYALYDRTPRMKVLLVGLFLTETTYMLSTGFYTMLAIQFSPSCLVKNTPVMVLPMRCVVLEYSTYLFGRS
jgi:hypothetical protein